MITLEQFKLIFKHIDDLDKNNDKLTELLVCKDTCGWISYADDLVSDIFNLLKSIFDLPTDDDIFEWYLYDISDGNRFSYDKGIKYDLNSLDDLYYYLIGEFDKVKQEPYNEKQEENEILNMSFNETVDIIKQIWEDK